MSGDVELRDDPKSSGPVEADKAVALPSSRVCRVENRGWLKGGLAMAICCAAPLLLVGAIALFGISLGALASSLLSIAAVLACPLGMYFMIRMMMKRN